MADIAKLLKEEITRLARKEVKKNVVPLRAKLISLSRTVSRQQKALDSLEKTVARQNKLLAEAPALPGAASEEEVKKSRVNHLRKLFSEFFVNFMKYLPAAGYQITNVLKRLKRLTPQRVDRCVPGPQNIDFHLPLALFQDLDPYRYD